MRNKMGAIGTVYLLLFVVVIIAGLMAAVAILQTAGQLKNEGHVTAQTAEQTTSSKLYILSVVGSDARDGDVELFCEKVKLAPGSAPVRMDQTIVLFETADILRSYVSGTQIDTPLAVGNPYITLPAELFDIDGDGLDDSIRLIASFGLDQDEQLEVKASSNPLELIPFSIGADLATAGTTPVTFSTYGTSISGVGAVTGDTYTIQLSLVGTSSQDRTLSSDMFFAVTTLENIPADAGVYSIVNNHDSDGGYNNIIKNNHVSTLCFSTEEIGSDDTIKINHIPTHANPTLIQFTTPSIMSMQKVDLYPWYEG